MKIIKIFAINILTVVALLIILKTSYSICMDPQTYFGPNTDLTKSTFWVNNQQVTPEEYMRAEAEIALKGATKSGYVQFDPNRGKTGLPATSTPANTTPASTPTKETIPKVKLTVWFTDALGRIIGSSQVTKGTDIADSQFPAEIPNCEGMTFDHWDYDGRLIEHEYIVRAIYK